MKPRLLVEQKINAFVNQYSIYAVSESGGKGELVAFAQQKRLAFKEKVEFYNDQNKSSLQFIFRAEKVMDIHGNFLVEDSSGKLLGSFQKQFAKSLFNSTWTINSADGNPKLTISEKSQTLAVLRRFGGFIPIIGGFFDIITSFLRYHFVLFPVNNDVPVGKYEKITLFRDHYKLSMDDEHYNSVDWRIYAALVVALDALQGR